MSWEKVKLGEILNQYRIEHRVDDKAIYKQVSILNDGSVVLRGEKFGKEIGRKRQFIIDTKKYPNTLIFTRQLLLQGSIGIASDDVHSCIVTENMPMFSIDTAKIDKEFLILFLKSEVFKSRIREIELSGSAQKSIHERTFLNLEFSLPIFQLQKEIVVELLKLKGNSDDISTEVIHQLSLVKKLRQQLLQDAVQGKLVEQNKKDEPASELLKKIKAEKQKLIAEKKLKKEKELPQIKPEEIPFDIPENWSWCRLGEIADIKRGKSPVYSETGISKMLNQKCVRWYELDLDHSKLISESWYDTISLDFKVKANDVLVNSTGEGTIGRSALASEDAKGYVFDSHILKISSEINQTLLCYYINSNFGQSLVEKSKGATSTKQTELGVNNLSNFIFPLSPLSEQNRIVQKLDELMQYCNELEASIKQSESQNEKLLQQVLKEALRKEPV